MKHSTKIKILKASLYFGFMFGWLLLFGAVGSYENNAITTANLLIRSLIGILISIISLITLEKVVNYYDN